MSLPKAVNIFPKNESIAGVFFFICAVTAIMKPTTWNMVSFNDYEKKEAEELQVKLEKVVVGKRAI